MKFTTELVAGGGNTAGFVVPEEVVEGLGAGRRPKVVVTVAGHTWRSSIASMGGQMLLGMSIANRAAAGVEPGQVLEVEVVLDDAPRVVEVPDELAAAFAEEPALKVAWDALSYSAQRREAEPIAAAKAADTRARRIEKTIAGLRQR